MPIKTVRGNQVVVPKVAPPVVPQVQQPERYSPNLARSLPTAGPAGQSILGQIGNVLTYPFTWAGQALMRGAEAIGLNPVAGPLGQAPAGVTGRYGPTTIGQPAVVAPQKSPLPPPAGYYVPGASHPTFFANIRGYQPDVTRSPRGTFYPGSQPLGSGYQPGVTRSPRGTRFAPYPGRYMLGAPPTTTTDGGLKPPSLTIPGAPGFTAWTRAGGGGGGGGGTRYNEGLGLVNWRIGY